MRQDELVTRLGELASRQGKLAEDARGEMQEGETERALMMASAMYELAARPRRTSWGWRSARACDRRIDLSGTGVQGNGRRSKATGMAASHPQILIAEDDHISRKLLRTNLEHMGYPVTAAGDGDEAWRYFDRVPTRVVVSDWLMPGLDGLELCQRIRERPNTDYCYFILLTANISEEGNYELAMEKGVDDFLAKPLDRHQLMMRLRVAERILKSTSRIQSLENVLTICAYTKKINFPEEGWQTIEEFMDRHLGIRLSHGVEPDYYESVIKPQLDELKQTGTNGT